MLLPQLNYSPNLVLNKRYLLVTRMDDVESGKLVEKAKRIKATGGRGCRKQSSQALKVRKKENSMFVGAFCQSNVGDVTPNVGGAFCLDTGNPCDFNRSSCHGNDQLCVGRGPG